MKALGRIVTVAATLAVLFAGTACNKINEICVTSYRIRSIEPKGLRSVDASFDLGIHNPTLQFTLQNNKAVIYHLGKEIGTVVADDLTVEARTDAVYPMHGNLTLADGVGIYRILTLYRNFREEDYSLDIDTDIRLKGGAVFKIRKRDIPLTEFVKD